MKVSVLCREKYLKCLKEWSRCLFDYDAKYCCGRMPTFQRYVLPPSSGWNLKMEAAGRKILPNIGILPHHYTASKLRIPQP